MTAAIAMAEIPASEFQPIKPVMSLMPDTADGTGDASRVAPQLEAVADQFDERTG